MAAFLDAFRPGHGPWDPSHRFETSWLLPPWLLCGARALFSLFTLIVQFFNLGWDCTHEEDGGCYAAGNSFSYFTVLTYWGLAFYFLVAAVHTGTYAHTGVPLLERFPRSLQALHSAYYSTIVVYPFVVTIVYWVLLFPGTWFSTDFTAYSNISQHAINAVFALFEIILPRTDLMPAVHVLWLIVLLALYLALAYLTKATKGFYVYDFLDPSRGPRLTAAYISGVAAACVIVFGTVRVVIWARKRVTESVLGMEGKLAGTRQTRNASLVPEIEMMGSGGTSRELCADL